MERRNADKTPPVDTTGLASTGPDRASGPTQGSARGSSRPPQGAARGSSSRGSSRPPQGAARGSSRPAQGAARGSADRGAGGRRADRAPGAPGDERDELDERVVDITRVAKVLKGGRRFGFRAVVVVGDNNGQVGVGVGKARSVPDAIRKGSARARRDMQSVPLLGVTIPHEVEAMHGGAKVLLRPASRGTGVIAGGGVRAVVEAAGVRDLLSKSLGSSNALNVILATLEGLRKLRSPEEVAQTRGRPVSEVSPPWSQGRGSPADRNRHE